MSSIGRRSLVVAISMILASCALPSTKMATTTSTPTAAVGSTSTSPPLVAAKSGGDVTGVAVSWVLNGQVLLDAGDGAGSLIDTMLASDATSLRARVLAGLDALRRTSGGDTTGIRFRQAALSTRVDSSDGTAAVVEVWWVGVVSIAGALPPTASWSTSTVMLTNTDGRWFIADETTTQGPSPLPSSSAAAVTSEELDTRLQGFTPWGAP